MSEQEGYPEGVAVTLPPAAKRDANDPSWRTPRWRTLGDAPASAMTLKQWLVGCRLAGGKTVMESMHDAEMALRELAKES